MVARKGAARLLEDAVSPAHVNCPINIRFGAFICVCSFLFAGHFINEVIPQPSLNVLVINSGFFKHVFLKRRIFLVLPDVQSFSLKRFQCIKEYFV